MFIYKPGPVNPVLFGEMQQSPPSVCCGVNKVILGIKSQSAVNPAGWQRLLPTTCQTPARFMQISQNVAGARRRARSFPDLLLLAPLFITCSSVFRSAFHRRLDSQMQNGSRQTGWRTFLMEGFYILRSRPSFSSTRRSRRRGKYK